MYVVVVVFVIFQFLFYNFIFVLFQRPLVSLLISNIDWYQLKELWFSDTLEVADCSHTNYIILYSQIYSHLLKV